MNYIDGYNSKTNNLLLFVSCVGLVNDINSQKYIYKNSKILNKYANPVINYLLLITKKLVLAGYRTLSMAWAGSPTTRITRR